MSHDLKCRVEEVVLRSGVCAPPFLSPGSRPTFGGEPHLFCDCESCLADWEDISLDDFIGSDSDPDDDFYYDDT